MALLCSPAILLSFEQSLVNLSFPQYRVADIGSVSFIQILPILLSETSS